MLRPEARGEIGARRQLLRTVPGAWQASGEDVVGTEDTK
jgi:hypothetical protein